MRDALARTPDRELPARFLAFAVKATLQSRGPRGGPQQVERVSRLANRPINQISQRLRCIRLTHQACRFGALL
jgi:hypothetical protein